jgi:hypothetical protein
MEEGKKKLVMFNGGKIIDSVPDFIGDKIWLRAHAVTITDKASFYYSKDNKSFKKIGNILNMRYRLTVFTGTKFCIFNYTTKEPGGYVDVNWFRMTTKQGPLNLYKADEMIEAEMYDEIYKADTEICRDVEGLKDQDITKTENGSWISFDQIDFGKGVRNFFARAASESGDAAIEIHLGSIDGPVIGTCKVGKTGGRQSYQTFSCPVSDIKGIKAIVLKFTASDGNPINLNWFSFSENPYSLKYSTD